MLLFKITVNLEMLEVAALGKQSILWFVLHSFLRIFLCRWFTRSSIKLPSFQYFWTLSKMFTNFLNTSDVDLFAIG